MLPKLTMAALKTALRFTTNNLAHKKEGFSPLFFLRSTFSACYGHTNSHVDP